MMKFLFNILSLVICLLLAGCQSSLVSINGRYKNADYIAIANGFTRKLVKGDTFWLTTYQRITNKNLPYVFYIEGDGLFYIAKYQLSSDPTPVHPIMLKLAAMDHRPNVVYIARPCQYTQMNLNPKCNPSYWTDRRMSEEVVESINEVIETINSNGKPFSLVGYSGGGGIAVLIAAKNKKVQNIVTLAGNLDHVNFNKYHNARPMLGSLNPIDYASHVRNIPQLHVTGGKDTIVPPFIADKFVEACHSPCVHQEIFTTVDHKKGWEKVWPYVLEMPLVCYKH